MTTPHQGLPDTVETMLGTGAYEIGGAGTDFGQAVDESVVTNLFRIPNPTEANKVDVFEQALSMLPADSLAAFEPVIPDFDPADTPDNWITQLLESLFPRTTPDDVGSDLVEAIVNMWNEWFGVASPDPDGTPEEVAQVFESIRATVAGGFTLQTFTSSDAAWAVPDELRLAGEAYAVAINGGGKGAHGLPLTMTTTNPGTAAQPGGVNGGYRSVQLDPSTLGATLAITVGAASTTNGAAGGISKIMDGATELVSAIADVGAVESLQGYLSTTSVPGSGGSGGFHGSGAPGRTGVVGESSAVAAGGAGGAEAFSGAGADVTASAGSAGANGNYTILPISGGAGGGGGGAAETNGLGTATGGAGGNGGFPGGASGGGGNGQGLSEVGGVAGVPANGIVAVYWKG